MAGCSAGRTRSASSRCCSRTRWGTTAARSKGLEVGLPTFIPFVGAWVALKQMPRDAETEAYIGLAGPLIGSLAALGVYWIARDQHSPWLYAVAYAGFMLNLFNLIPLSPFDGDASPRCCPHASGCLACRC